jgi:hypothetical protein
MAENRVGIVIGVEGAEQATKALDDIQARYDRAQQRARELAGTTADATQKTAAYTQALNEQGLAMDRSGRLVEVATATMKRGTAAATDGFEANWRSMRFTAMVAAGELSPALGGATTRMAALVALAPMMGNAVTSMTLVGIALAATIGGEVIGALTSWISRQHEIQDAVNSFDAAHITAELHKVESAFDAAGAARVRWGTLMLSPPDLSFGTGEEGAGAAVAGLATDYYGRQLRREAENAFRLREAQRLREGEAAMDASQAAVRRQQEADAARVLAQAEANRGLFDFQMNPILAQRAQANRRADVIGRLGPGGSEEAAKMRGAASAQANSQIDDVILKAQQTAFAEADAKAWHDVQTLNDQRVVDAERTAKRLLEIEKAEKAAEIDVARAYTKDAMGEARLLLDARTEGANRERDVVVATLQAQLDALTSRDADYLKRTFDLNQRIKDADAKRDSELLIAQGQYLGTKAKIEENLSLKTSEGQIRLQQSTIDQIDRMLDDFLRGANEKEGLRTQRYAAESQKRVALFQTEASKREEIAIAEINANTHALELENTADQRRTVATLANLAQMEQKNGEFFDFLGTQFALVAARGGTVWDNMTTAVQSFASGAQSSLSQSLFDFFHTGVLDMEKVFKGLMDSMLKAITDFLAQQIVKQMFNFGKDLSDNWSSSLGGIGTAIVGGATKALGAVGDLVGSAFSALGDILPFAAGGFVPQAKGTDTVPAMLTPGEFVVPADLAQDPRFASLLALFGGARVGSSGLSFVGAGNMSSSFSPSQVAIHSNASAVPLGMNLLSGFIADAVGIPSLSLSSFGIGPTAAGRASALGLTGIEAINSPAVNNGMTISGGKAVSLGAGVLGLGIPGLSTMMSIASAMTFGLVALSQLAEHFGLRGGDTSGRIASFTDAQNAITATIAQGLGLRASDLDALNIAAGFAPGAMFSSGQGFTGPQGNNSNFGFVARGQDSEPAPDSESGPSAPDFARGGVVPGPYPGAPVRVTAHTGEEFRGIGAYKRGWGGGVVVNLTVHAEKGDDAWIRDNAKKIAAALDREMATRRMRT